MDVKCTKCSEPWDWYHIRHDALYETSITEIEAKNWDGKLTPRIRDFFAEEGWEFGSSPYVIFRCPCCKNTVLKDRVEANKAFERAELSQAIADVLGDDEDGIISELADLDDQGLSKA